MDERDDVDPRHWQYMLADMHMTGGVIKNPGWVGQCDRCGHVLVLEEAQTNELGQLLGWGCYEPVGTKPSAEIPGAETTLYCHGTYHAPSNQEALISAFLTGGLDAVKEMLPQ